MNLARYYMMELSYYLGGLLTLPVDNKRKDFYELIIHHLVTNFLIMFSWGSNFWRVVCGPVHGVRCCVGRKCLVLAQVVELLLLIRKGGVYMS